MQPTTNAAPPTTAPTVAGSPELLVAAAPSIELLDPPLVDVVIPLLVVMWVEVAVKDVVVAGVKVLVVVDVVLVLLARGKKFVTGSELAWFESSVTVVTISVTVTGCAQG